MFEVAKRTAAAVPDDPIVRNLISGKIASGAAKAWADSAGFSLPSNMLEMTTKQRDKLLNARIGQMYQDSMFNESMTLNSRLDAQYAREGVLGLP